MKEKAAQELCGWQHYRLEALAVRVVFVGEGDRAGAEVQGAQPGVADGHAVRVAAQVVQDVVRAHEHFERVSR